MPVKKNKAGKRQRHDKTGEHSRQMNKDRDTIKKMVGDIPALIMKEGYLNKKTDAGAARNRQDEESHNTDEIIDDSGVQKNGGQHNERRANPLFEEHYFANTEIEESRNAAPIVITHPKKRLWLWTGVIIVTMVIFGIWILNLKNIFYDIRNSQGFEEAIISGSKKDFNDIWTALKINDKNIEEQAKKADADASASTTDKNLESFLNEIITPLVNASTTAIE